MNRYLSVALVCSASVLLNIVLLIPAGIAGVESERKSSARIKVDELFKRNCARCHGADGRGATPSGHLYNAPDFTDPAWWEKHSAITNTRSLRSVVARGKAGMPGFSKKLSKTEINLLVGRILKFQTPERKR